MRALRRDGQLPLNVNPDRVGWLRDGIWYWQSDFAHLFSNLDTRSVAVVYYKDQLVIVPEVLRLH